MVVGTKRKYGDLSQLTLSTASSPIARSPSVLSAVSDLSDSICSESSFRSFSATSASSATSLEDDEEEINDRPSKRSRSDNATFSAELALPPARCLETASDATFSSNCDQFGKSFQACPTLKRKRQPDAEDNRESRPLPSKRQRKLPSRSFRCHAGAASSLREMDNDWMTPKSLSTSSWLEFTIDNGSDISAFPLASTETTNPATIFDDLSSKLGRISSQTYSVDRVCEKEQWVGRHIGLLRAVISSLPDSQTAAANTIPSSSTNQLSDLAALHLTERDTALLADSFFLSPSAMTSLYPPEILTSQPNAEFDQIQLNPGLSQGSNDEESSTLLSGLSDWLEQLISTNPIAV